MSAGLRASPRLLVDALVGNESALLMPAGLTGSLQLPPGMDRIEVGGREGVGWCLGVLVCGK